MAVQTLESQKIKVKCGSILVNDLQASIALYRDVLKQDVVELNKLSSDTANAWGAPRLSNADTCLLQPKSKAQSYLRLIQSPDIVTPTPHATTFGWCAFEINVADVFALAESLSDSGFKVVGPPKRLDNIANVIPMQVVGPDQEVLFLNQVLASDSHTDLPIAKCEVDRIFIAILASKDREGSVNEYVEQLVCQESATHQLRYSLINRAFGLDAQTKHRLTLVQDARNPIIEVDQYPIGATPRPTIEGNLSHGNTMVSVMVNDLGALPLNNKLSDEPIRAKGHLYNGCRSIVVRGSSGELLELIEAGRG